MSDWKDSDKQNCSTFSDVANFKNALRQFQKVVEKTVAQKKEERLGLYIKDENEIDYDKFCATVQTLFGPEVKDQDVKAFFRKISNNPDGKIEWCEIFGYFIIEGDALASQLDEENMVFLVSRRRQITKAGVKRRDAIRCIVKVPQLDFLVTASQKGTLTVFNSQMRVLASTNIADSSWITGCDYLTQLKRVVAVTERTVIIWDYKSQGSCQDNCFIIKPMEHCLLCVSTVNISDQQAKDDILMGDDGGHVSLLTVTSDDFGLKQSKAKRKSQLHVLDSRNFKNIKRKLHDDWVVKVKYISVLNCFGSCSLDSVHSFVLDDLKRLEDNKPVREFSVPKGVNAFTYCGKANIIVTGGDDKVLRLWHPSINTKPVGKLLGHLFSIMEIVTNEKDQHIVSLSSAKVFRVWDIQTLSLLQVFHDIQGRPGEMQIYAMVFDNTHGKLITGSSVIDIYPLTRMIQDTKQIPQTHEKSINVLAYNWAFHQVLTICAESIVKIWELETGYQVYQIEDAHGPNIEITCAAIEKSGFHFATGACDGTMKIWDFGSGQEIKDLPLARESREDEQWLQLVYLKANESQHMILALEQSGKIKIVQTNKGEAYLTVTWELPEAIPFLQKNAIICVQLKPNTRQPNGFFPDVQLLLDSSYENEETQDLPPGSETKCFDVLKVEEYSLLATGRANGGITLWNFESATVRYLWRSRQCNQTSAPVVSGVTALLFLFPPASFSRHATPGSSIVSLFMSDITAIQGPEYSHVSLKKENLKSEVNIKITEDTEGEVEETVKSKSVSFFDPKGEAPGISKNFSGYKRSPILASAHENGNIYLWNIKGDLLREVLPFTKYSATPLTVLCIDLSVRMLLAGSKEGHIMCWDIGSFLEDPEDSNKQVKQQLFWRAHSTKVVSLFYEKEKKVVVTASVDGSVRLWHATNGHYFGYLGQPRVFELSEPSDLILPCDINEFPTIIKESNKYMEMKQTFEYPLVLDREKWKSLTRSSLIIRKPRPAEVDRDFKFFKALASPKINRQPLESFKSGNKEAGVVFGSLPIYRVISSAKLRNFPPLCSDPNRESVGSIVKRHKRPAICEQSRSSVRKTEKWTVTPGESLAQSFPSTNPS
ncbi:WD repeat-containing protein 64 [Alligator mississippiensis]|uniref:WD repeat-containing protein 64 n=1 Tax=Alligator mississippiensis TaxID=8496 RepID=A0A151MHF7_ALLMI|nr:WD repeat-containing protein 64 [Alligator mississippiensis]KYO23820.1 WD repeat-containing protein 64 [Alligator mississippiensis]